MPQRQRDAHRAARVTGSRLNPDFVEDLFPQEPAVADAIERDAAGETQIAHAGFAPRVRGHLEHHLFGDFLDGPREVHLALRQLALGFSRRAVEQLREPFSRHREAGRVGEVLHVHPQAAVVGDLEQVVLDGLDVLRLAVRREAHDLVFAGVHLEPGEVRERGIQEPERVRKPQLPQQRDLAALPHAD